MMSGKRLLDAVAVFNAARAVAYNHFHIRQAQVELYARTSSLTRGINRANQASKDTSNSFRQSATTGANAKLQSNLATPNLEIVNGEGRSATQTEGIGQDHHYDTSPDNSVADSVPSQERGVQRDKAKTPLVADGRLHVKQSGPAHAPTDEHNLSSENAMKLQRQSEAQIPSKVAEPPTPEAFGTSTSLREESEFSVEQEQDVFQQPPDSTAPVLSALPRVKIPKIEEDVQEGDPHIPQNINGDVFYSSRKPSQEGLASQVDTAQEEPPEEVMSSLFRSPRVARLLGTKSKNTFGGLRTNGSRTYVSSRQ